MILEEQLKNKLQERMDEGEAEIELALKKIFKKPVASLTEEDIGFLRARVSYLEEGKLAKYASILEVPKEKSKTKPAPADGKI